jgi:hypothetical protein
MRSDVVKTALMQIKIPRLLVRASDRFADWGNVPVYREVRRLDVLLVAGLTLVTLHGYWIDGWWGALLNFLMFTLGGMVGLWFF